MEQEQFNIGKYIQQLKIHRYLFIFTSIILISIMVAVAFSLPKKYKADSTVFIQKSVIDQLVKGLAVTPDIGDRIRVLRYALLSRDLIYKVLQSIDDNFEQMSPNQIQQRITSLQKRTQIEIKRGDLFIVSVVDPNPSFAQKYINALVRTYVDQNLSSTRQESYGANRFLDKQVVFFKKRLDKAENAIIEFRRKKGLLLTEDESGIIADVRKLQDQMVALNLEIQTQKAKRDSIKEQLSKIDPTVAIFNEGVKQDRITRLQQRLHQLLLNYTDNYPDVIRLKAEIQALKESPAASVAPTNDGSETRSLNPLYQGVSQKYLDAEAELSALQGKYRELKAMAAMKKAELNKAPENRKQLAVLTQDRDSARQIYEALLGRAGKSEVSKQMEIGDKAATFRIVDPALLPLSPVAPDMVRMILMAIAAGIGGGLAMVFLVENLNGSVKDLNQLQELELDVLAVIPRIPDPREERRSRRNDILAYATASIYFSAVICLLAFEAIKRFA